jgi:ABC-type antimicrobial peptide transport system permease subunit
VVGVVGRIKQYTLDETDSRIAMYHPHTQVPSRALNVVVRTTTRPESAVTAATREIRAIDSDLPIYNVKTMQGRVDESLAQRRFAVLLLSLFAAVALILASIGVYSVMAYVISQGTRDIGIRMALGASPRSILALVVGQGLTTAALGVAIGMAGALAIGGTLRTLLFGVSAADLVTYAAVSIVLTGVALTGSYIPARRAARIDPVLALRSE